MTQDSFRVDCPYFLCLCPAFIGTAHPLDILLNSLALSVKHTAYDIRAEDVEEVGVE